MGIDNLQLPLEALDDTERENFVVTKINSIVTRRGIYVYGYWGHILLILYANVYDTQILARTTYLLMKRYAMHQEASVKRLIFQ